MSLQPVASHYMNMLPWHALSKLVMFSQQCFKEYKWQCKLMTVSSSLASQGEIMCLIHAVRAITAHIGGKKNRVRRMLWEKEGGGGGGLERSLRSGLRHCFLACSSSSRHPSSLFEPEHRGCLAPGHHCQRLETQGSAHFPNHCFTVGCHSGKIALLYSFNRRQAQFGLSRSGSADGQYDGWMSRQAVMEQVFRSCA